MATKGSVSGLAGRARSASGRFNTTVKVQRLELLGEVMTSGKVKAVSVRGLTALASTYQGLTRARKDLYEQALDNGVRFPLMPNLEIWLGEMKLTSTVWQAWYGDKVKRAEMEAVWFDVKVLPGEASWKGMIIKEEDAEGKLVEVQQVYEPAKANDTLGMDGFASQWTQEEDFLSIKRQLQKVLLDKPKLQELYEDIRKRQEEFAPHLERLIAEGFDWRDKGVEAQNRPAAAEKVSGLLTLQEMRRVLDGYGELPREGAEASDDDWQTFLARFEAANGAQGRKALTAAMKLVRAEQAGSGRGG